MRTMTKWVWAAASAAGLALASPGSFAAGGGHGGGGHSGGGHSGGGHYGGGHYGGGHYGGGHYGGGHYYGHGGYYGGVGFYFGLPLFWGSWWDPYYYPAYYPYGYGYGYGYPAYYPSGPVVYRDYVVSSPVGDNAQPALAPSEPSGNAGTTAARPVASFCASANAYYPAVRTCPEGWRISSPQQ